MRWLVGAALTLLLVAAALFALLFLTQRRILFPAPRTAERPADPAAVHVRLGEGGRAGDAWYLPPVDASGPSPLLVFAHGNAETAVWWVDEFRVARGWGMGVLLVEYPGYGASAGAPSKASIERVMRAAHDWATRDPRVDASRVVLYGRSLGGAAAAGLAGERPVAALVLESSFTAVRPLAEGLGVPGVVLPLLLRDPFDSIEALRAYRGPLLVVHGTHDEVIPVSHGRALAAAVPGAQFVPVPCGHNDCPRPWDALHAFLRGARVLP